MAISMITTERDPQKEYGAQRPDSPSDWLSRNRCFAVSAPSPDFVAE
jgi:hypothetical protein